MAADLARRALRRVIPALALSPVRPAGLALVDLARRGALLGAILISGGNLLIPRIPVLAVVLLLGLLALAATARRRTGESIVGVVLLLGVVLLASLWRSGLAEAGALVTRYANFAAGLLMLLVYLRAGRERFVTDFVALGYPLAFVAIATVALATLAPPLFQPLEVEETVYHHLFLILNYHVQVEDLGGLMRANGPFYEPGVFHIYLNLLLYIFLFVKGNPRRAAVAALAVAATQSTTGLAIASGLGLLFLWRELGRGSIHRRAGMLLLGAAVAALVAGPVIDNLRSKLVGDLSGSGMARQFDLITGVNVILAHPLIGIGFDPETYRQVSGAFAFEDTLLEDRILADRGNTNGVIVLFYSVGIPLALVFLFGLFRQTMLPDRLLVGGLLFVSLLTESILFTPFFQMFIMSGLLVHLRPRRR